MESGETKTSGTREERKQWGTISQQIKQTNQKKTVYKLTEHNPYFDTIDCEERRCLMRQPCKARRDNTKAGVLTTALLKVQAFLLHTASLWLQSGGHMAQGACPCPRWRASAHCSPCILRLHSAWCFLCFCELLTAPSLPRRFLRSFFTVVTLLSSLLGPSASGGHVVEAGIDKRRQRRKIKNKKEKTARRRAGETAPPPCRAVASSLLSLFVYPISAARLVAGLSHFVVKSHHNAQVGGRKIS